MLSTNDIKKYASLKQKKFRNEFGLFLVEGFKTIEELLKSSLEIQAILGSEKSLQEYNVLELDIAQVANTKTMQRISTMKTASSLIAVVHLPKLDSEIKLIGKTILVDDIQDPGNLGTIIRTAHWFGFKQVVCSLNSVDLYNYKVIQASMGAVFKMDVNYTNLQSLIPKMQKKNLRVLGTFMEGESIYDFKFAEQDVFILGNEGKGISTEIEKLVDQKITIPNFMQGNQTESLNISIAGAVVCSEMASSIKN